MGALEGPLTRSREKVTSDNLKRTSTRGTHATHPPTQI